MAAAVDGYSIFLRTQSAVTRAASTRRLDYTITVSGLDGSRSSVNHYRATTAADGTISVASISSEQAAHPPDVPGGFNFNLSATLCGGTCVTGTGHAVHRVGAPAQQLDLLGVPVLSPAFMFGLQRANSRGSTSHASAATLPTIAVVSTKERDYAVTVIDQPTLDSEPTYHLLLRPLRLPKRNRLRELWVGRGDFLPRKAIVAGNFTIAPLVDVPWTIQFSVSGGLPLVAREAANATLYMPHRRVVRNAVIAFDDVRPNDGNFIGKPILTPDIDDTTLVEP